MENSVLLTIPNNAKKREKYSSIEMVISNDDNESETIIHDRKFIKTYSDYLKEGTYCEIPTLSECFSGSVNPSSTETKIVHYSPDQSSLKPATIIRYYESHNIRITT